MAKEHCVRSCQKENINPLGLSIAVASAVIFGLWPPATRGIYAEGGNAAFALLITTWARALALAGYCIVSGKPLFKSREATRQALLGGFFQAISIISLFKALEFLPGPLVIIVLFSHTLMLLFFMAWRGEIMLNAYTVVTTVTALFGLSLVLDIWHKQSVGNLWGIGLAFVSALATVSRLYVWGHQTKERNPAVVGAECFVITGVFTLLILFFSRPHVPTTLTGDAYAALGCAALTLGTFGMFYGIALLGSFRWSLFLKLEPVFTALFSALLLGEILKPLQYMGIGVVLISLALYQIMDNLKKNYEKNTA